MSSAANIAERYRAEVSALELARMWIRKQSPFYGALIGNIPMRYDDSISTACTDGKEQRYNPEFFDGLPSIQDRAFIILHELGHDLARHSERRRDRDPQLYNVAADYVINAQLRAQGYTVSTPHLYDEKYTNPAIWSTEQVYADLMKDQPDTDPDFAPGDDVGGMGSFADAPKKPKPGKDTGTEPDDASDENAPDDEVCAEKSGADAHETDPTTAETTTGDASDEEPDRAISDKDITRAIQAARLAELQAGTGTTETDRILAAGENREDWQALLQHWVRKENSAYSFARPNKRFQGSRIIMPSLFSDDMPALIVSIDCSGSCWDELPDFVANVTAIHEDVKPECTIVVYFTSKVCAVERFYRDEPITINACYSGGTDFRPVFAAADDIAAEYEGNLIGHVMLTDCYGEWPDAESDTFETLVISTSGQVGPDWCETIHCN